MISHCSSSPGEEEVEREKEAKYFDEDFGRVKVIDHGYKEHGKAEVSFLLIFLGGLILCETGETQSDHPHLTQCAVPRPRRLGLSPDQVISCLAVEKAYPGEKRVTRHLQVSRLSSEV